MDIKAFVYNLILPSIGEIAFNRNKLTEGIDAYIEDNGFYDLTESFDDSVIKKVITNNLAELLSKNGAEIVLFFSNYKLIEKIRLINNKSLQLAKEAVERGGTADVVAISELESRFEDSLKEIYKIDGLNSMLKIQISDIILNLDYAKKTSPYYSLRLRDTKEKQ